jgi:hypothetical protein
MLLYRAILLGITISTGFLGTRFVVKLVLKHPDVIHRATCCQSWTNQENQPPIGHFLCWFGRLTNCQKICSTFTHDSSRSIIQMAANCTWSRATCQTRCNANRIIRKGCPRSEVHRKDILWCRCDISTVWIWWMEFNTVVCGLPLTHITAPLKYEVDWPSTSQVMERNGKSEMATPIWLLVYANDLQQITWEPR